MHCRKSGQLKVPQTYLPFYKFFSHSFTTAAIFKHKFKKPQKQAPQQGTLLQVCLKLSAPFKDTVGVGCDHSLLSASSKDMVGEGCDAALLSSQAIFVVGVYLIVTIHLVAGVCISSSAYISSSSLHSLPMNLA